MTHSQPTQPPDGRPKACCPPPGAAYQTFSIVTLGCKVNQYESERLARTLTKRGLTASLETRSEPPSSVDVCIVNTCCVTQKAAMQSRQALRKAIRQHPGARIIATGCYAQTAGADLAAIQGVHQVVGQADKATIPRMLFFDGHRRSPTAAADSPGKATPASARSRPYLKIQDGCDAFCSYCIVPHARGPIVSVPPKTVMAELDEIVQTGRREVVLTGVHLGRYGIDLKPPTRLAALLAALIETKGIDRIRLSSIEPLEINDALIDMAAAAGTRPGHVCRHFHIPMQSGDDRILKQMGRPYRRRDYAERVLRIHQAMPDAAIGADVMIGFPGESAHAFEQTMDLIDRLPLSYLHVFPFSARQGTPAAGFSGKIPPAIVKARCRRARALGERKRKRFFDRLIGSEVEFLIEHTRDRSTGLLKGVASNYAKVRISGADSLKNTFQRIRICGVFDDGVLQGLAA